MSQPQRPQPSATYEGATMKTAIEVKDRKEAEAIKRALERSDVRAFVVTMGVLSTLPSDRSRARVLHFVADHLSEEVANAPA